MVETLRNVCNHLGVSEKKISILYDFFGYRRGVIDLSTVVFGVPDTFVPGKDSILQQIKLLKSGEYLNLNLILVGINIYSKTNFVAVEEGLRILRDIYSKRNIAIGRVKYYELSTDQTTLWYITNGGEAKKLTNQWTVHDDGCDIFFVWYYKGSTLGISARDGPCDKDDTNYMTGSVVELNDPTTTGQTLGHEIGHYLGLKHYWDHVQMNWCMKFFYGVDAQYVFESTGGFDQCLNQQSAVAKSRMMFPTSPAGTNTYIGKKEASKMRKHCFVHKW